MLYYNRIDVNEGIDPKSYGSKEYIICDYWFFNNGVKFQDSVCNRCHHLTILCFNISKIAIITVWNVDYRYIIHDIIKFEIINLLENSVL